MNNENKYCQSCNILLQINKNLVIGVTSDRCLQYIRIELLSVV